MSAAVLKMPQLFSVQKIIKKKNKMKNKRFDEDPTLKIDWFFVVFSSMHGFWTHWMSDCLFSEAICDFRKNVVYVLGGVLALNI